MCSTKRYCTILKQLHTAWPKYKIVFFFFPSPPQEFKCLLKPHISAHFTNLTLAYLWPNVSVCHSCFCVKVTQSLGVQIRNGKSSAFWQDRTGVCKKTVGTWVESGWVWLGWHYLHILIPSVFREFLSSCDTEEVWLQIYKFKVDILLWGCITYNL